MTSPTIIQQPGWGEALQKGLAPLLTAMEQRRQYALRVAELQLRQRDLADQETRTAQQGEMDAATRAKYKLDMEKTRQEIDELNATHEAEGAAANILSGLLNDPRGLEMGSPEWNVELMQRMAPFTKDPTKLGRINKAYEKALQAHIETQQEVEQTVRRAKIQKVIERYPDMATNKQNRQKALAEIAQIDTNSANQIGNTLAASDPADPSFQPVEIGTAAAPQLGAFNTRTGQVTDTGFRKPEDTSPNGSGGELKQARMRAAANSVQIIMQMEELLKQDPEADVVPDASVMANVLGGAAKKIGADKAADRLGQAGFTTNQMNFQRLADQFVHTYGGTLPGSRNQLALLENFRHAFFNRAGQNDPKSRVDARKERRRLLPLLRQLAEGRFDPKTLPFYNESVAADAAVDANPALTITGNIDWSKVANGNFGP